MEGLIGIDESWMRFMGEVPSDKNLNELTVPGVYMLTSAFTGKNSPGQNGLLIVYRAKSSYEYCWQESRSYTTGYIKKRYSNNGCTVWSEWT